MNEVLAHFSINDPPTKYVQKKKRTKFDKSGKEITQSTHYLTGNIFYDGTHWAIKSKIVNYAKDWLLLFIPKIPLIEKCNVEITYHSMKDNFDLDNKVYFWTKIFLDLMKTPSTKQILRAQQYNSKVKTISVIDDDTVRYIDNINMIYKRGAHKIEFKITGRRKQEQIKMLI